MHTNVHMDINIHIHIQNYKITDKIDNKSNKVGSYFRQIHSLWL